MIFHIRYLLRDMRVGKAVFKENMDKYPYSFNRKLLDVEYWDIGMEKDQTNSLICLSIFEEMISTDVSEINASCIFQPDIILKIIHVNFPSLAQIYLDENNITNIEKIVKFNAPELIKLRLRQNRISNIRSLRKIKTKCLEMLQLQQNLNRSLNLRELNAPQLKYVSLEKYRLKPLYPLGGPVTCECALTQIIGWESKNMHTLYVVADERINNWKMWKILEEKGGTKLQGGYYDDD